MTASLSGSRRTRPAVPAARAAVEGPGRAPEPDALARLRALDGAASLGLDKAARLARFVSGAQYAAVHLFEDGAQHRVAAAGGVPLVATPEASSMCVQVVRSRRRITTSDATRDARFDGNPFTTGPRPVRFYSSTPLRRPTGEVLGTLCVFDTATRELSDEQLGLLEDVAEQVRQHLELHSVASDLAHSALHDPLTGLANRSLLSDRLTQASSRRDTDVTSAVAMVDLDRFKEINDSLGHAAGDAVLVEAARRLQRAVRAEDTVARLGGDEFVVLYERLPRNRVAELLPRLRKRLASAFDVPVEWQGRRLRVGASVGLTAAEPGELAYTVLGRADALMYEAKAAAGR